MSDPGGHHASPMEEALSHGGQRVAQLASLIGAAAEVIQRRRARQSAETDAAHAATNAQERIEYQQARMRWAPAHDPRWLAHADLMQTARVWSAAIPYADTDPAAAAALRKCEERLRALHPYAMSRYTRLIADGMTPVDAMRETLPLFGRAPRTRTGETTTRPAIEPAAGDQSWPPGEAVGTVAELDTALSPVDPAEQHGRQIALQLQARTRATGQGELSPDELEIVLETVTNLPDDVITRIVRQPETRQSARNESSRAPSGTQSQVGNLGSAVGLAEEIPNSAQAIVRKSGAATEKAVADRTPAQVAAESFPHSATDVVSAASTETAHVIQARRVADRPAESSRKQQPGQQL